MAASMDFCLRLKGALEKRFSQKKYITERLAVCQRTKQLHNGEFHVPKGCLNLIAEELAAEVDDIRDTLIKESQSWSTRISDVRTGKHDCLEIFVDRLSLYSSCIGTVCKEGSGYGKTVVENGENVLLDLVCGSLLSAHEDLTLTLDDLRALALAQHIQLLLESQGHHVSVAVSEQHLARFDTLIKVLHMSSMAIVNSDLSNEDIQSFMKEAVHHQCCKSTDDVKPLAVPLTGTEDLSKSELSSDIGQETETCSQSNMMSSQRATVEEKSYEFNIKQFLEEKGYHRDKNNFDKNLHLAEVITEGKPSDIARHVMTLEKTMQENEVSVCLHIVQQNQAFQLQKVHTVLEGLLQQPKNVSQSHFIYGPVSHRKDDTSSGGCTVDSYLKLRHKQMHDAAVMKYGAAVKGEGWENTIKSVTSAGIKFELLSSVARTSLKLDLSDEDVSNISDSRNGSFVMYNCARLATLFLHFQQAVEKGLYPPLPDIKDIDFSTLREEAEWTLMFNYVHMYPETVRQVVEEFIPADSILSRLQTHKICVFLSSLSRCLSSYYSRTHVLGESRPHLLPVMYARLYLLKAVHQVMLNGLALLGITALTQL